jgi:protease I
MDGVATREKLQKLKYQEKNLPRALFVIAFRNFRDPEYFLPKEILENSGIEVKTVSNKKGIAIGAEGGEVEVDFLIEEVNPKDFDAIIFIGGPGCLEALDNEKSYNLIKQTVDFKKILGAICIAPVILAKSGVLEGKKATVWSSPFDRGPIKILKENGANFVDENVVQDGKIITANGPEAAKDFGRKILEMLKGH